jgi:putative pyoverdin transport system ATP-binding/permease protein
MLIPRSRLVMIVASIAAVAAMESAFMLLLVATVTHLGPFGPDREALLDFDPVIVGGCLLISIAALRSGLSRAVLLEAGRARRHLEELFAGATMGTDLRSLERRSHVQAETVIADIERLSAFVSDLRIFVPSAISATTLLMASLWLSPLLSSVLGVIIVGFIGTMRFRFMIIGLRDRRLARHRDQYLKAARDATGASRELRLGAGIRQSLNGRFLELAKADRTADAVESLRLGLCETLGFALIAGFALGLAWAATAGHFEAGVAGAYAMLILLLLPALMTTSALYARCAEVLQANARLQSLLAALPPEPGSGWSEPPINLAFRGLVPQPDQGSWRGAALSFDLAAGSVVYIVGGNGAGKTTTLKAIAGLYPISAGNVVGTWPSGATHDASAATRRQMFAGVFAEGNIPLPTFISADLRSAIEIVGLSMRIRLDDYAPLSQLSYGERRRVDLALALAEDRSFLILDEPTANQSPEFKDHFFNKIVPMLTSAGKGLVIATHDMHRLDESACVIRLSPEQSGRASEVTTFDEVAERSA